MTFTVYKDFEGLEGMELKGVKVLIGVEGISRAAALTESKESNKSYLKNQKTSPNKRTLSKLTSFYCSY